MPQEHHIINLLPCIVSLVTNEITAKDNQPVLIFCLNGKVRTGCVVGCIRKQLQGWAISSIMEEFEQFAEPEGGLCDLAFIDRYPVALNAPENYS